MPFRKSDIFFYLLLIFLIVFPFIKGFFSSNNVSQKNNNHNKIKIKIGKNYIKYFNSDIDSIYNINENNAQFVLNVKNKNINVLHSNCKSQICKKTGKINISSNINQIICIPNKTIISFEKSNKEDDTDDNGLDGISG